MNPQNARSLRLAVAGATAALLVYVVGYLGVWQWGFCRVEVPPGSSLLLQYRGPWPFGSVAKVPEGTLVQTDPRGRPTAAGVLEHMPGPGRHFYSPLEFYTRIVPDTVIPPGKLGLVTCKAGKELPPGQILVDEPADGKGGIRPEFKGILRRVLTPGRYRLNEYAFEVKPIDVDECVEKVTRVRRADSDPTMIPPGYVGVVTNKTGNPAKHEVQGIQAEVLPPGIYFLNPVEKRVDVISVGFNETSLSVEVDQAATAAKRSAASAPALSNDDPRGDRLGKLTGIDPVYTGKKGIEFPSSDGFLIHLDFTAIWGISPDQAPDVVRKFGTLKDVEQKVVLPQIGSICRMHGSRQGAVDLLVGETREQFQAETSAELEKVLKAKDLTLLFGLTRHIYVPAEVREPIQRSRIADELTKTREQEQLTAKAQADLTEAKAKVTLGQRTTEAETLKLVAQLEAEGEKKAKEIEAETEKLKAEIDAKTATIEAQSTKLMGEAEAKRTGLTREAEADRFKQYVAALGTPEAYNRFMFAEGLSDDLKLGIFYAGPGTLWTDLKGFEQILLGKLVADADGPRKPAATPTSTSTSTTPPPLPLPTALPPRTATPAPPR